MMRGIISSVRSALSAATGRMGIRAGWAVVFGFVRKSIVGRGLAPAVASGSGQESPSHSFAVPAPFRQGGLGHSRARSKLPGTIMMRTFTTSVRSALPARASGRELPAGAYRPLPGTIMMRTFTTSVRSALPARASGPRNFPKYFCKTFPYRLYFRVCLCYTLLNCVYPQN